MSIEIKVPILPESISEGTIAKWYKKLGEAIRRDEPLLDVETDKVVLEVVAPDDGFVESMLKKEGETVSSQEVVALFKAGKADKIDEKDDGKNQSTTEIKGVMGKQTNRQNTTVDSPSMRRRKAEAAQENIMAVASLGQAKTDHQSTSQLSQALQRKADRVPMSRIRARIAERLLEAQQNAAILTTFNEVNMQPVMDLRQKYKDAFERNHGVRLGFMSFFVVACTEALKRFPIMNASVEGSDILYHHYYDIGIAVSAPRGLVVPIIRDAEGLTMAEIEKHIIDMSQKAKHNQLTVEDLTGGTFTITNGGVFGSLMATPIINPPQSAILGMHKIEERPIALNGVVVIRPMMYIALSYDHRIIDGADSVRFLVTVKEILEDPARLCLGI